MISLKLIFVLPSIKPGGGNRVFIELANSLKDEFKDVSIIYPNNSEEISQYASLSKIKITAIGKSANKFHQKILNVITLIKKINYTLKHDKNTLIIISDPIQSIFFNFLQTKKNPNTIRFVQADDYRIYDDLHVLKSAVLLKLYKWLCKKSFKGFENYIFNSVYTYEQFIAVSNTSHPCVIVHPGMNTDIFRNNYIRNEGELNICIIARKHPWKGFSDFLKAWEILPFVFKNKINRVFIISHDNLDEFHIPDSFELIKPKDDIEIAETLNKSHIFVSTSWWEGFGLPPLEGMACGCAVISSNSKGILEYASDGHNSLLFEAKNVEELSSRLSLLISDNTLKNNIISNGTFEAKNFNWSNTAKQFKDYIIKLRGT